MNYIRLFAQVARKNENRAAVVDRNGTRTVTYGELNRLSSLCAGKIHSLGCGEGDLSSFRWKVQWNTLPPIWVY